MRARVHLCLCMWLLTKVASAQSEADTERARALFSQGVTHADAGRYHEALTAFRDAYAVAPHFAVLYNIARIRLKLGDREAAMQALETYLDTGGEQVPAARRQWALATLGRLRSSAASAPPDAEDVVERGEVRIHCPWFDFDLTINGRRVARSPFSGSLFELVGTHEVGFTRPGYLTEKRSVVLSSDEPVFVECRPTPALRIPHEYRARMKVAVSPDPTSALLDGRATALDADVPAGRHTLTVDADGHVAQTRHLWLPAGKVTSLSLQLEPSWTADIPERDVGYPYQRAGVFLGAGGIAWIATGIGIYIWNDNRYDRWEHEDRRLRNSTPGVEPTFETRRRENNALLESIHHFDTITWLAVGVGGVFTVVGGGLALWPDATSQTTGIGLAPTGVNYRTNW